MELAVLGTGVHAGRQIRQQRGIEPPAGKARRQLARIDAGDVGLEPAGDHAARERTGLDPPQREQRRNPRPGELLLAVAADVLQEQIAERHGLDTLCGLPGHERAHDTLVLLVWAGIGDLQHMQRQSGRLCLGLDQRPADAMHGDAIEGGVDGRDQPDHVHLPLLAQDVQRPGRVLARAPAQQCPHCRPPAMTQESHQLISFMLQHKTKRTPLSCRGLSRDDECGGCIPVEHQTGPAPTPRACRRRRGRVPG